MVSPAQHMWVPPSEFAEYVVERKLGGGAMGQVYLARDTVLARPVAIKFIATSRPSEAARRRFLVEARAAARLAHANVAAVHRVGDIDDRPYLVSEFVEGKSLDTVTRPMPEAVVLRLAVGLARGLAEAHRHGVLHRDIKPANVILAEDDTPKLVDFGLAKLFDAEAPPEPRAAPPTPLAVTADISPAVAAATAATGVAFTQTFVPDQTFVPAQTMVPTNLSTARGLTRAGALLGTPDYMSPESWRGEPATERSDVYSFGALIYELLTGAPPHADVSERDLAETVQSRDAPPIQSTTPHVNPRFAAVVHRCLQRDPELRYASAGPLREELENLTFRDRTEAPQGNPWRGLQPFDAHHRGLFFGREAETEEIAGRLGRRSFVLVTGDSGTGKSSLCRAAVLPGTTHSGLMDGRSWATVTVSPGPHPLTRLASSLASFTGRDVSSFFKRACEAPSAAALELQKSLGSHRGLVCFVDQLEELLTQSVAEEAEPAEAFLAALASGFPGIKVLATARADFLTRLASMPLLGPDVPNAVYLLRPMDEDRLRRVILQPAEAAGLRFESEALVESLIEATAESQASLPLLQFALSRLWEVRDTERMMITDEGLRKVGGVGGALARHADRVVQGMVREQRQQARDLLMRLVGDDGVRVTRDVEDITGGDPARAATLNRLVQGRLVTLGDGQDGTTCTLVHDVLLTQWATLAQWRNELAESNLVRERLQVAAREWGRVERDPDMLWSGALLREAGRLDPTNLTGQETDFIAASRRVRRRTLLRRTILALAVPLLLGGAYLEARYRTRAQLETQLQGSLTSASAASEIAHRTDRAALDDRARAANAFLVQRREAGEAAWADAREHERALVEQLRRANQGLEAAIALAPDRLDIRERFARLLFTRAKVAHRMRAFDRRDELLQRLELYDADRQRLAAWNAPGRVSFVGLPPEAKVRYARYLPRRGRLLLEPLVAEGPAAPLRPGRYRASVDAYGHTVHFPFTLDAEERLSIDGRIPPPDRVPEGYVFVPAGRFRFGSTAGEDARLGFFDAPPVHTATTGAYLISRHEITFADWIAWLEALPDDEAEAYAPGLVDDEGLTTGGIRLTRDPSGVWALAFRPGDRIYRARAGEPIRYADRASKGAQDWLKFPVVAVSAQDGEAYARWLDATRRVPGARLCSEHEWERAARGADDREYPHGDHLEPDDLNFDRTYGKRPGGIGLDEVGAHPASTSPFGVDDLAGNAFEWTTSSLAPRQYVLRGGSYYYDASTNRSTNRAVSIPTLRVTSVGLRICAPPPQVEES